MPRVHCPGVDPSPLTLGAAVLGAYLLGAIPFGLVLGLVRGVDLRSLGSGNIGATNAVRAMGKRWGVVVFALDAAKAAVPVLLAKWWLAPHDDVDADVWTSALAVAGVAGHIFPVYLRFKGGKGVACAFGAFGALSPTVTLAAGVVYLQLLILTRISGLGSLTATVVMVLGTGLSGASTPVMAAAVAVCLLIWMRHRSNLAQLLEDARARRSRKEAARRASGSGDMPGDTAGPETTPTPPNDPA